MRVAFAGLTGYVGVASLLSIMHSYGEAECRPTKDITWHWCQRKTRQKEFAHNVGLPLGIHLEILTWGFTPENLNEYDRKAADVRI